MLATGCGASPHDSTSAGGEFVRLADVTPLEDPKSWEGPSSASLPVLDLVPVAESPTPSLPVTVTDSQGTEVTVDDASRILALDLYGTTARTIYELGLGDNLVGRDTSSAHPELAHLPLVTPSGHDLNAESILALAPTLIITDTSLGPWDVVLQMRDAGVSVVVVDSARSMETVADLTRQIAGAVGLPEEGELLAERTQQAIDETMAQIAEVAPSGEDKLRVIFLYMRGQSGIYYLFGQGSGTDSLIEGLGATDIATEVGLDGMRPLTDEGLIAAAPDVVLVMTSGLESVNGVDGMIERLPALANTPAGDKRRIVDMADTEILSFGSSTPAVLESLAVALYAPQELS